MDAITPPDGPIYAHRHGLAGRTVVRGRASCGKRTRVPTGPRRGRWRFGNDVIAQESRWIGTRVG